MGSPTKWNDNDKSEHLNVELNGLRVSYKGLGQEMYEQENLRARKIRLNCPDLERMRFDIFWNKFLHESIIIVDKELEKIFYELWKELEIVGKIEIKPLLSPQEKRVLIWNNDWKPILNNLDFEFEERGDLLLLKSKSNEITSVIKDLERHEEEQMKKLKKELRIFFVGNKIL
ncbi:4333_t:CDS:2, partial [Racocetra fulgida]